MVAGAQTRKSMRLHRQTNGRRVSDFVIRAMLRERVRNGLPIDAKTIRGLDIACGSDRLRRLRREVLQQIESEFTVEPGKTDGHTVCAGKPVAAEGGGHRSPNVAISPYADRQRARGARAMHPARPRFLAGFAAACSALLRQLISTAHCFASQSKAHSAD
jgi:hypothetical protein